MESVAEKATVTDSSRMVDSTSSDTDADSTRAVRVTGDDGDFYFVDEKGDLIENDSTKLLNDAFPAGSHIALTGGLGFVGSEFVRQILEKTRVARVVVIDRYDESGTSLRLTREARRYHGRLTVVYHDLKQKITPGSTVARELDQCLHVLHLAAASHVDRSIKRPRETLTDNAFGTLNILSYLRTIWGAEGASSKHRFLQFSTDEVFGSIIGEGAVETNPHNATNPYAASKSAAAMIAKAFSKYFHVCTTTCMNLIGEHQMPEKFLPLATGKAMRGEEISVAFDETMTRCGSRAYVAVRDVVRAASLVIVRGPTGESYNIEGSELTNLEVVELIGKGLGVKPVIKPVTKLGCRPGNDLRYALNGNKIIRLGYRPSIDVTKYIPYLARLYAREYASLWTSPVTRNIPPVKSPKHPIGITDVFDDAAPEHVALVRGASSYVLTPGTPDRAIVEKYPRRILITGAGSYDATETQLNALELAEYILKSYDDAAVILLCTIDEYEAVSVKISLLCASKHIDRLRLSIVTHDLRASINPVTASCIGRVRGIIHMEPYTLTKTYETQDIDVSEAADRYMYGTCTILDFMRDPNTGCQVAIVVRADGPLDAYGDYPGRDADTGSDGEAAAAKAASAYGFADSLQHASVQWGVAYRNTYRKNIVAAFAPLAVGKAGGKADKYRKIASTACNDDHPLPDTPSRDWEHLPVIW